MALTPVVLVVVRTGPALARVAPTGLRSMGCGSACRCRSRSRRCRDRRWRANRSRPAQGRPPPASKPIMGPMRAVKAVRARTPLVGERSDPRQSRGPQHQQHDREQDRGKRSMCPVTPAGAWLGRRCVLVEPAVQREDAADDRAASTRSSPCRSPTISRMPPSRTVRPAAGRRSPSAPSRRRVRTAP